MATFEVYRDVDGLYAWTLTADSDWTVALQSGYSRHDELLEDIAEVRLCRSAQIVDLTGE